MPFTLGQIISSPGVCGHSERTKGEWIGLTRTYINKSEEYLRFLEEQHLRHGVEDERIQREGNRIGRLKALISDIEQDKASASDIISVLAES